jgi:error-prone DNA polymerase
MTLPHAALHVHSSHSLREGVAAPADLAEAAARCGYAAIALTDRFSMSGGVRFVRAAQAVGVKALLGTEVVDGAGDRFVLLADGPSGYASLCRLITACHLEQPRRHPEATADRLDQCARGVVALLGTRRSAIGHALLHGRGEQALALLDRCLDRWGKEGCRLVLERLALPGDGRLEAGIRRLAELRRIPVCAAPPVRHLRREDLWLSDLAACLGAGVPLSRAHAARPLNAEAYLWPAERLRARYDGAEDALTEAALLAERLAPPFTVPARRLRVPAIRLPAGATAEGELRREVGAGVRRRYGDRTPNGLWRRLDTELSIIGDLGYAGYFLMVLDIIRFARRRGIRFAGRGSSADSAVAYTLGITEVDAHARGLLFERFLSRERGEKPDIDIDFDARRRDEVAAYVTERYGAERVAAVGTLSTYRARSAVRELGAALGFGRDELDRLAKHVPDVAADAVGDMWRRFPELAGRQEEQRRYALLWRAAEALAGAPRFPSTHLGGLVVSDAPLSEVSPVVENAKGGRTLMMDKDDVEDMGLIKLDLLSLRALSALERTVAALGPDADAPPPPDDPRTFASIRRGETIGVFQLESPAQRVLQARLGACTVEDLVHSVALIRPGPIKGNMVDPFVARRRGEEPVSYPHPALEPILRRTYGVVLFQEQVIEIAVRVAGFTPGEADRLRRVMSHDRSAREMEAIGRDFVAGAQRQGFDREVAEQIFEGLRGYASYGFCEAHAAAFGALAYRTAYLLEHAPAESFAGLLAEQPMGYYPPWILVTEMRRRGLSILPVDINRSEAVPTAVPGGVRAGFVQVAGVGPAAARRLAEARPAGGYTGLDQVRARCQSDREVLENLVRVGAFDSLGGSRRALLRQVLAPPGQLLLPWTPAETGAAADFTTEEKRRMESELLGFETGPSIWLSVRPALERRGILPAAGLSAVAAGRRVKVAGWPFRPHRPPTRSGRPAAFFSLVDETGIVDGVCFGEAYARCGRLLFSRPLPPLVAEGRLERRGEAAVVRVDRVTPLKVEAPPTATAWTPVAGATPRAGR